MSAMTILDPTSERVTSERQLVPRLDSLAGKVVGLLDISKPKGDFFLNRIEQRLVEMGATVKRFTKPTFTKPAPADLKFEIASTCDAVIEALAD